MGRILPEPTRTVSEKYPDSKIKYPDPDGTGSGTVSDFTGMDSDLGAKILMDPDMDPDTIRIRIIVNGYPFCYNHDQNNSNT